MYEDQYGYDSNYNSYHPEQKSSHTDIQKINCDSRNINVNGIDITQIPQDGSGVAAANGGAAADAANNQNDNCLTDRINFERNLVNICVNVNANEQVKVSPPADGDGEENECEQCFTSHLDLEDIAALLEDMRLDTLGQLCDVLAQPNTEEEFFSIQGFLGNVVSIDNDERNDLLECLANTGVISFP